VSAPMSRTAVSSVGLSSVENRSVYFSCAYLTTFHPFCDYYKKHPKLKQFSCIGGLDTPLENHSRLLDHQILYCLLTSSPPSVYSHRTPAIYGGEMPGKTAFTLDSPPTAGRGHDVGIFPWVTMLENSTDFTKLSGA
jgi:hypothetical protein